MLNWISNTLFLRKWRAQIVKKKFVEILGGELIEGLLEILLKLMGLVFCLDKDFRKNIRNFDAKYVFKDKNNDFIVSAVFKNSKLKVKEKEVKDPNITIIFKDEMAFLKLLFSPKPDILTAILNQDVTYVGNLNYLTKFGYMAIHLKTMALGA